MGQAAAQGSKQAAQASSRTILAADVGGTYARIGLVRMDGGTPHVAHFHKYRGSEYPGLGAIIRDFLGQQQGVDVTHASIACAGYVLDDAIINNNLPWRVSLGAIRRELDLAQVTFVNDFTAIAYAIGYVDAQDTTPVIAVPQPSSGPKLVVGPGTGLGAAVRIPGSPLPVILSTEAGQAALTAATPIELDVMRLLLRETSHVPTEYILSGPGLSNLYRALGQVRGVATQALSPMQISAAAASGTDVIALETLRLFCGWLGSVVGNLALLYGAQGGVYLAGGILPQIKEFVLRSDFAERFRDKGAMRAVLERVPVHLVEHGQLGVLGAAGWHLDRHGSAA